MSQCSENHVDEFVARPHEKENEGEVSISGGMLVIRVEGPANQTLLALLVETPTPIPQNPDEEVARAEMAYQGMMASLPTFVKNSTPPNLSDDQLDGITSYFSIPITKVDTRLALPGEQLYLPRIEEDSEDPDMMFGYTSVYVEAFSFGMRLPFSRFVNDLLITLN
ncbi:hypothetical protein LIER_04061 [Lithospermum erythrorhizon]|uniref:Uncharacterized protein n=1 Tax=Lithospermum erythrorhizon TaxID=34254 RepID=A0AAV3NY55_LITER